GAVRRRLQQHAARAEVADDPVRDRRPRERHADQILLRRLDALLDRRRHLLRLADAEADHAVAVADDDEGAEAQVLAALDALVDGTLQLRIDRRRRDERLAGHVVDHLRVDVGHAAEDAQTRPLFRAGNPLALPELNPDAAVVLGRDLHAFAPVLPAFFF